MADPIAISSLRWRVALGQRLQSPDSASSIIETLQNPQTVWADVQPVGPLTFWGAQQTDTPVTHKITFRWIGYIDNSWAVIRTTQPDLPIAAPAGILAYATPRTETFRVRRVLEVGGRKRFTVLECELEHVA